MERDETNVVKNFCACQEKVDALVKALMDFLDVLPKSSTEVKARPLVDHWSALGTRLSKITDEVDMLGRDLCKGKDGVGHKAYLCHHLIELAAVYNNVRIYNEELIQYKSYRDWICKIIPEIVDRRDEAYDEP